MSIQERRALPEWAAVPAALGLRTAVLVGEDNTYSIGLQIAQN